MRTLVTGATGRVGSRLVPVWAASMPLRVVVRDVERAGPFWDRGSDVLIGDLRDPDLVKRAVAGVDAVVHLAAAPGGAEDVETAVRLGRAALDAGVRRFVFASTHLVYGPGRGRPAHEDDPPSPGDGYPHGKAAAERALLSLYHDGGLGVRIVRLAVVYGDGDPHLVEWLPGAAAGPAARRIHTVHHADVARGLWLALTADGADGADGRIFNLADDAALTAWELCAVTGRGEPAGQGPADPWQGVVDTRRIRDELGFRPIYPTVYAAHADGAL